MIQIKKLTALRAFVKEHNLPLGIVLNQSEKFEWIADNIIQIPIGWL